MEELFDEPRKIEATIDEIVSELKSKYPSMTDARYPPSFRDGRFHFKLGIGDMELKKLMGAAYPNAMGKSFAFVVIEEPFNGLYKVDQWFYFGTTFNSTIGPGDLPQPDSKVKEIADRFARNVEFPIGHSTIPSGKLQGYWNSAVSKQTEFSNLDQAKKSIVDNVEMYERHSRENFSR